MSCGDELVNIPVPSASMRAEHLKRITTVKHSVYLKPSIVRPIRLATYRVGPEARHFKKSGINNMLVMNVIQPADTKRTSQFVFASKKNGTLKCYPYYTKINEVTIRGYYPSPRMDERLETLGDAHLFLFLDASSS